MQRQQIYRYNWRKRGNRDSNHNRWTSGMPMKSFREKGWRMKKA
jgi:hypothetical protein